MANGLFGDVHPIFRAVLYTGILITGGLVGLAYSDFNWHKTIVDRLIEDNVVKSDDPYDRNAHPPPNFAEKLYLISTVLVPLNGVWLLITAWVPVF